MRAVPSCLRLVSGYIEQAWRRAPVRCQVLLSRRTFEELRAFVDEDVRFVREAEGIRVGAALYYPAVTVKADGVAVVISTESAVRPEFLTVLPFNLHEP